MKCLKRPMKIVPFKKIYCSGKYQCWFHFLCRQMKMRLNFDNEKKGNVHFLPSAFVGV